jgi:hypothetical protein
MKITILTFFFMMTFFVSSPYARTIDFAEEWRKEIINRKDTSEVSLSDFVKYDLSPILSNRVEIPLDPWSSYEGVLGPEYKRIEFHINAKKLTGNQYLIEGKRKLGSDIKPINGQAILTSIREVHNDTYKIYCAIFDYQFADPGTDASDGLYSGVVSVLFDLTDAKAGIFWAEGGDYREINNMFVGARKKNNTNIMEKCIFSFHAAGLFNHLMFTDDFTLLREKDDGPDYYIINNKYLSNGWKGYDSRAGKSYWWK